MLGKPKYLHSFAKQFIASQGYNIYRSNLQILQELKIKKQLKYDFGDLNTLIISGQDFLETVNPIVIDNYEKLRRLGLCIISEKIRDRTRYTPQQKKIFRLAKLTEGVGHYGQFPTTHGKHYAEYDVNNQRVRLCGPNTDGPMNTELHWTYIGKKPQDQRFSSMESIKNNPRLVMKSIMSSWLPEEEKKIEVTKINELPAMLIDDNRLLCIKKEDDMPLIQISGKKGSGKTYQLHAITDRAYWQLGDKIAVMNDRLNQCFHWTLPNPSNRQAAILNRVNQDPRPLPCVFLYPSTSGLKDMKFTDEDLSFKTSIPFSKFCDNYNYFLREKKEWQFGASTKHFLNLKQEIKKCCNLGELDEVLDELKQNKLKQSADKIYAIMSNIFKEKFLDTNTGIPAYWEFKKSGKSETLMPLIGLMKIGAVPVINTSVLKLKHYYPTIMRYMIDAVFNYQNETKNPDRCWMIVDEVGDICKVGNRKTVASDSLLECVTEGRMPQIGMVTTIQNYGKLDAEIRGNTAYCFTLVMQHSEDVNALVSDYSLESSYKRKIGALKTYEMYAMCSDRKFVIYDKDGNRTEESGIFKGTALPPLSMHRSPTAMVGGEEDEKE